MRFSLTIADFCEYFLVLSLLSHQLSPRSNLQSCKAIMLSKFVLLDHLCSFPFCIQLGPMWAFKMLLLYFSISHTTSTKLFSCRIAKLVSRRSVLAFLFSYLLRFFSKSWWISWILIMRDKWLMNLRVFTSQWIYL